MAAERRPNVVFILMDNVGWGDVSLNGGGVPTPHIDALAHDGLLLENYNVEAQCTPTRAAILTGRLPVRSGTFRVPYPGEGLNGLTPWEYTLAELLSDAGYSTALLGKWHLGDTEGRLPTDQGFDEWWGIKNSSDEAGYAAYRNFAASGMMAPKIWEGRKGALSRPVADFNLKTRAHMDEEIAKRSVAFIEKHARDDKPFFMYIAFTNIHPPLASNPAFVGKGGPNGPYGEAVAELDARTGQILDAIDRAGLRKDTIVVLSSDNAAAHLKVASGSNLPWRGDFFTPPFEGSYRTLAAVRWPGRIAANTRTNELVAAYDWYATLADAAGAKARIPTDRPIDSVDISPMLLGKTQASGRESFIFDGPDGEPMAVKWKDYKVIFRYWDGIDGAIHVPQIPMIFDLAVDPQESDNLMESQMDAGWVLTPVLKSVMAMKASMVRYPNVKPGKDFSGYSK